VEGSADSRFTFWFGLVGTCSPRLFEVYHAFVYELLFPCSLGCIFWLACAGENVPLHSPFVFAKGCSREFVPFAGACNVLLVSSLYRKLVLLFLIYTILTFDKKKYLPKLHLT
jgi:hypothetical protein